MSDTLSELILEAREHMKAVARELEAQKDRRNALTATATVVKLDKALTMIGVPRMAA
jgi:hypothetical protein